MNRIDRLFGILLLLQAKRHIRAEDIAAKYEISERTVYRDMSALMQLGVPIISQAGEGYSLLEGYYLPPLIFTTDEAKALFLGVKMLQSSGNLPEQAQEALIKLKTALPDRLLKEIDPLIEKIDFLIKPGQYDLNTPYLLEIQQAIREQKVIHLRYTGWRNKGTSERDIEPIKLSYGNNTWYVSAHCRLRNDMRSFRVDRIEELQVLSEKFSTEHHQADEEDSDEAQIEVKIAFSNAIVRWVRERQHYSFVSEKWDGDKLIMSYQLHTLSEIRSWIMGWGSNAEVLSPDELRQQIREEARKMLSLLT